MALASVLETPLPVNQHGFFGLRDHLDLLDLGPGCPSDGLSLTTPSWGIPEEPGLSHCCAPMPFNLSSTKHSILEPIQLIPKHQVF
uniref:Uncharacterized protein n=1 Tax=Oryctolagus cuniculus TaxID=9986 RepID=A0A5F9D0V3_RABIT